MSREPHAFRLLLALSHFVVRLVGISLARLLYRIRVEGGERVPSDGPALLVANHVAYVDAVLLSAVQKRPIRFLMGREIYDLKWLKP